MGGEGAAAPKAAAAAPKAAVTVPQRSPAANGGGNGGRASGKGEKGTLVAAGEVVGRPLAVWSQKLLDWPKAVVAGYRAESTEHLVRYENPAAAAAAGQPAELWVRLSSVRFQWLAEQPERAAPNPTAAGAPQGDDCVGRRLKVFWPGMGRWYQGKVQSYDAESGRHCVKYRDGDIQHLRLRHEAVIWVDAGPRPPRPPAAAQPPAKPSGAAGAGGSKAAAAGKPAAAGGKQARGTSPAAAKRPRLEEGSSGDERLRSNKSSATREAAGAGAAGAAGPAGAAAGAAKDSPGSGEAGAGGGSSNIGSAYSTGQSTEGVEEGEGGALSSGSELESEEEDDGDSSVVTDDLGSEVYSSDLDDGHDSDFEVESARPAGNRAGGGGRRRAGAAAGGAGRSRKRKRSGGGSRRPKKSSVGRPRKKGAQDRRPKASAAPFRPVKLVRVDDEAARMAGVSLVGARVAVRWVQDGQYYRGKLVQFDSYHKRSKILYDDGEEEWISLTREAFKWLTPRGRSAGYGGEMKEALAQLGGPHVDAEGAALPGAGATAPLGGSRLPGASPATPAVVGEVGEAGAKGAPAPKAEAEAAVGWQVSVLFDGDGQWYRGEVLAFDKRRGRHLVLYDDGEDEWLALERESLAWHKLARGASAACPGVRPGTPVPKGRAAVGWRVGVFWPQDMVFYTGQITAFDDVTAKHTVVYDDGEVRSVSITTDRIKWILPPGGIVDPAKCLGMEANTAEAMAAAARVRKKGGAAGESDPDYEFGEDARGTGRPPGRRLPRLLTTASLATDPSLPLPAEVSTAALLGGASPHHGAAARLPTSPYAPSLLLPPRGLAPPLAPGWEQSMGEPLVVRQLTRVPTLGASSTSSGESDTTQLPNPITVRIFMSSSASSGGAGGGQGKGDAANGTGDAPKGPATPFSAPLAAPVGPPGAQAAKPPAQQRCGALGSVQGWLGALDLMSRRVLRAQHALVKGVPGPLPPHPPPAAPAQQLATAAGAVSPTLHAHTQPPLQQQRSLPQQQLHRLARTSTAEHPLSPVHRRPHPAQSDEDGSSSSGSSDNESEREESPAALLSPRSAAALNGAKIKPDASQRPQSPAGAEPMELDAGELLDAGGTGTGTATPCDSDALGPVPPLVRPVAPALDSPFSAGVLLRGSPSPAPAAVAPLQVYSGQPVFPEAPADRSPGGGQELPQRGGGSPAAEPSAAAAPLGVAHGMGLAGGTAALLCRTSLPAASACPMHGLLAIPGPSRRDSEFNLLAMGGPDLAHMGEEEGGLMELVGGVGPPGAEADAEEGMGGAAAALVDAPGMLQE